jgi:hypothetical protein
VRTAAAEPIGTGEARDQRSAAALAMLTLPAATRYSVARVSPPIQWGIRVGAASLRLLARIPASALMMLADLAGSRSSRRVRRPSTGDPGQLTAASDVPAASPSNGHETAPPKNVTVTPSGVRVVDKRKAGLQSAAQPADAESPGALGRRTGETTQDATHRGEAAVRASSKLRHAILGGLIRAGRRTPLPAVSDADLGRYAWERRACRQLLRDKPGRQVDLSELIGLAADETAGDWRAPVLWWAKRNVPPADLARLIEAEFIGPGSVGLAERKLITLMRLTGHAAAALPDRDAQAAIRIALAHSRKPVDPYVPGGLTLVARSLVSVLLEQRPELDEIVLNSLELQAGVPQTAPTTSLPIEARLFAIAIRNRAPDFGKALSQVVARAGLGPAQLETAAHLADAPLVRPTHVRQAERTPAPLDAAGFVIGRALPWLAPPALAAGAGLAVHMHHWAPAHTTIALGDSIALLALLAAVNVFTVQLSASRLPGVLARPAGQPWELFFSYSAALTLLGLSAFHPRAAWLVAVTSWAALLALGLLSVGVLAAMFRLLRRTDAGRAAGGYVARTIPLARMAGRRLGRIQANAAEMREALATVPAVKTSLDVIVGEWSHTIPARARGLFTPSRGGMRRLLARNAFDKGMRLRVFAGLGTIVGSGENIACLIPARDQTVTRSLAKQASRTLRTRSCTRVEDIAAGAVALTQMAVDLANTGDIGTARTVAQHVARLVAEHTAAVRRARRQTFRKQALKTRTADTGRLGSGMLSTQADLRTRDTEIVPVIPALRDTLRVAVQGRLDSRKDQFNVPGTIIDQLLSASGQAEAAVEMLTSAVVSDAPDASARPRVAAELLRVAGLRSLELRRPAAFQQVLNGLGRLAGNDAGTSAAIDIAGALAATACRFDVRLSKRAIDWALARLDTTTAPAPVTGWKAGVLWRTGAAGLACGAMSVAVYSARTLFELGAQDSLAAMASDRELIASESVRSNLLGGYLGDQPEDALNNFGIFARELESALQERVGAGEQSVAAELGRTYTMPTA